MKGDKIALSLLIVCEANVCRSPTAEFILSTKLPNARVESAGLLAVAGKPSCEFARSELKQNFGTVGEEWEQFTDTFRSRTLRHVDIADFDLVLGATREIRSEMARLYPALRDRFFTLREATALLGYERSRPNAAESPATRMNESRGSVPVLSQRRFGRRTPSDHPFDISDGHLLRRHRHLATLLLVDSTAKSLAEALTPAHPEPWPAGALES